VVKVPWRVLRVALLLSTAALPLEARMQMDPGAATLLWQVLAAAAFGSVFFMQSALSWLRARRGAKSEQVAGYIFGIAYSIVATPLTLSLFEGRPLPRFNDLFLVGIVLTVYLFSWRPAVLLLTISTLVSAWVLPPYGSMRVEGFAEWYRLVSFVAVSVFLICLIARKKGHAASEKGSPEDFPVHGAAAGAD